LSPILSQCSLFLLLLKFLSIFLGSMGLATNNVSCKSIGYLGSVFTRSTYWLTSWITVNHLLTVLFPTSTKINNLRLAIYLSIGTFVILLVMLLHESFDYQTLRDLDSSAVRCVTNFNQNFVDIYNRVNTLTHHLFFIYCCHYSAFVIQTHLHGSNLAKIRNYSMYWINCRIRCELKTWFFFMYLENLLFHFLKERVILNKNNTEIRIFNMRICPNGV
jgi:hypothetical protein